MKANELVLFTDVPVPIIHKIWHVHKIGGKPHRDFTKDYGDIPFGRFNSVTQRWEDVENKRGLAYGARKRLMYRKRRIAIK